MVRRLPPIALLALFCSAALAQDVPDQRCEVREGSKRPSPRITLVIDVSGSMSGNKLDRAITAAINIAIGPSDDLEIGVFIFDAVHRRLFDPTTNSPWFQFPSRPSAESLTRMLRSLRANGLTNPAGALRQAYEEQTQSIVLITDGEFNLGEDPVAVVKDSQTKLVTSGAFVPPLVILTVFTEQEDSQGYERLSKFAAATDAQLWTPPTEDPPPPEPEPTPASIDKQFH